MPIGALRRAKQGLLFGLADLRGALTRACGRSPRKRVLVDCAHVFHYHHIKALVDRLAAEGRVDVHVLDSAITTAGRVDPDLVDPRLLVSARRATYLPFDMTINLDYVEQLTWHPRKGVRVRAPHGGGMKPRYTASDRLSRYDVVFCIGPLWEESQAPFLKEGASFERIGCLVSEWRPRSVERVELGLPPDRPVAFYAPSWSSRPEFLGMDEEVLGALCSQEEFSLVIKPHPHLLEPDRCGGTDWRTILRRFASDSVHVLEDPTAPIHPYLQLADVLVSDFSSVVYQALLADKPIVLHARPDILDHLTAHDAYEQVRAAAFEARDAAGLAEAVRSALKQPDLHAEIRRSIVSERFFNVGCATEAATRAVYEHLGLG